MTVTDLRPRDGTLTLRALSGTAADRALVADLVRRSSPATLRSRFFLPTDPSPDVVLRTYLPFLLAGPPDGLALAALVDGRPVGLLNLVAGPERRLELGVLVADGWQRRGVAGVMLRHAVGSGRWPGRAIRATVQPGNAAARALIRSLGGARLVSGVHGEYVFELTLAAAHSERRNSMMATPSSANPVATTISSSSATGTCQPPQVTPGASAARIAGVVGTWSKTA
jgi:hypothetical protein